MVQMEDLNKEENLRKLIKDVATMANRDLSKEKEDRLVQAIQNNNAFQIKK